MPYEKETRRELPFPLEAVYQSAVHCIQHMGGKVIKQDAERGILHAQMDKKLFGAYLGDRSQLEIQFSEIENGGTSIYIFAFPLNAIGQKLMFGARQGVVDTMMNAFYQELEKHLQKIQAS